MPKTTNNWEERFDKGWARNNPEHPRIAKREAVKDFIRKEIAKAKQEERERIMQIVIEDVPHQYQERLLTKLKE